MITEGYFLVYDNVIWAVKGCFHPDGYAVAIPRLYKDRKIKKLNEALAIVKQKFQHLLKYLDEIGFEVPLVPLGESVILDPFDPKKERPEIVKRFLSYFTGAVGITGSLLYANKYNDMDFLSFNPDHYYTLLELRRRGVTIPLNALNEEEVEVLSKRDFETLKRDRVLEGIFNGTPYTFKIVECIDFGLVIRKKEFKGIIEITKTKKSYTLPVIYETAQGLTLTSFRTRFTEIKEGTRLYVDGILLERNKFLDLDLDLAKEVRII